MSDRGGTLRRWLVAGVVVSGIVSGIMSGTNPGSGTMSLTAAWDRKVILAGVSGAGNPDGADGVYAADFDGDGRLDMVTGHEQGLRVTLSFNPGTVGAAVESPWPTVVLPNVNMGSSEDAIACDVDKDGTLDILSASETGAILVDVFFGPAPPTTRSAMLNQANWTRVQLTASAANRSMRAGCADLDEDGDIEIIVGGKDANGVASSLGYYSSATPRTGASWVYTPLVAVGWVMQMLVLDFDQDGDIDIVYSDKVAIDDPVPDGTKRGLRWLDSNGGTPPVFTERQIILEGDHKWFSIWDADGDGDWDIADCRSSTLLNESNIFINLGGGLTWTKVPVTQPANVGQCQQATAVDVDLDGKVDLEFSYSNAQNLSSFVWLRQLATAASPSFLRGEVSGNLDVDSDVKMDDVAWVDVDGDGDLDAVNTEQHMTGGTGPGIGIFYFKNPRLPFTPSAPPPAIACTRLDSGIAGTGTAAVTASVSPAANAAIYVAYQSALAGGATAPSSVTGNGITYAQEDTIAYAGASTRRVTVFRGMSGAPSAGAITGTWGVSQTSIIWSVIQCTGVDPGGTNASAATLQSVVTSGTGITNNLTNTLAALAGAGSVHLAFAAGGATTVINPDSDFLELQSDSTALGVGRLETEWATNQLPVTPTWVASSNAAIMSLEVKIAP